ncbi:MAG: DUF2066 domain-containing protein [Rhodospirillales bacterium]|nr:DUF2066 domain-containing protein [Rhodospirillales bacterium]MSP80409.1 DUF2066 domain-containing protein [Rhodospirillales bacterium]
MHEMTRFAVVAVALAAWAAWPFAPGTAFASGVFDVTGVAVDVTAETAAQARERAIAEGERAAFRRLLERLTLRSDHSRLPELPRADIGIFLQDFSVADEKTSPVRYLAKLTFRFKAEEVRRLFDRLGVPFAETMSKPILVLPVYQSAGALLLWDDPNPWRSAWTRTAARDGLVPLVFAAGDLQDVAAIGAEQAAAGDEARLAAIAGRYATTDTVVASAAVGYHPQRPTPHVRVAILRHGAGAPGGRTTDGRAEIEVAALSGESLDRLLQRAAGETARLIEDYWKRENLLSLTRGSVAAVSVPIAKLADWLAVRKKLGEVSVVRRTEVILMSKAEVRLALHFIGEVDQLALALGQADLQLQREGDLWVLSLARPERKS